MITQIAWNTFKCTGNIDTFLEYKQIQNVEENIKVKEYGNSQNNSRSDVWLYYY